LWYVHRDFLPAPEEGGRGQIPGQEILPDHVYDILIVKVFTGEYVEISITGLVAEVTCNVGSLDELDQRISGLVIGTEMLYRRFAVRDHVDTLDEVLGEGDDIVRTGDHEAVARPEI